MKTSIVEYKKSANSHTEIVMRFPDSLGENDELHCTEIATVNGITYVAVPDGIVLPDQPPEITLKNTVMTQELKMAIRLNSPHCQFIDERRQMKIRAKYTLDDEQYMTRLALKQSLGMEPMTNDQKLRLREYDAYVEECLNWARDERAALGL